MHRARPRTPRSIDNLVVELTLEKARLTAGEHMWSTVAIDRLGIPKVRMTDGPNDSKAASDTGGGYAIGWIVQPNEWLEYTVNVASSGTFTSLHESPQSIRESAFTWKSMVSMSRGRSACQ